MKVAFYLGSKGGIQDKLIDLRTGSKYSHCELILQTPDVPSDLFYRDIPVQGIQTLTTDLCFSSSNRDGGTRLKWIEFKPDRWVFVDVPVNNVPGVEAKALSLLGRRYGWATIMNYLLPFGEHSKAGLICSEALVMALQMDGMMRDQKPWKVSPGKLYSLLGGK